MTPGGRCPQPGARPNSPVVCEPSDAVSAALPSGSGKSDFGLHVEASFPTCLPLPIPGSRQSRLSKAQGSARQQFGGSTRAETRTRASV